MSLKFRFITTMSLVGAIVVFSTFAVAQDKKSETPTTTDKIEKPFKGHRGKLGEFARKGFRGKQKGFWMRGFMRGIELTDTQKEQIKAIRETSKPDRAKIDEYRSLIKAKRDGALTSEQEARLEALRQEAKAKAKTIHEQIMSVLTDQQKAQIEKNKLEMKQRREQMRQKLEEFRKNRQADGKIDKPASD